MDAYKSINLIAALVWLYFAFMTSVLLVFPPYSSTPPNHGSVIDYVSNKPPLTRVEKMGKSLFKDSCAMCHNKDMLTDLTGPALKGVTDRWSAFPSHDLYDWIRNSEKMIAKKHPRAIEVASEWDYSKMNSMEHLKDEDINALIAFIER